MGNLDLQQMNYCFLTLVPKEEEEAPHTKDFRLISLVQSIVKIIPKILANRLVPLIEKLVQNSWSASKKGRLLLDFLAALRF